MTECNQQQSSGASAMDGRSAPTSAGGAMPRLVTRGETSHEANADTSSCTAIVDWLAFSLKLPPGQSLTWLREALDLAFCIPPDVWKSTSRGWNGYRQRVDLGDFGLLAHGGEAQRGTVHVELNAHACARIVDWNAVRIWFETYDASITRVDLAHDDFDGVALNIETAKRWYHEGRFTTAGRPPKVQLIDDFDCGDGKTLYIGKRANGKLLRVYEKGRQLGDPSSTWVRAEVELRNKGRIIPAAVVTCPGQYLAGAYPALAFLTAEQQRLRTLQRGLSISFDRMVENLRMAGGKAVNVMCMVHGGDAFAVVDRIVREGTPARLAGYPKELLPSVDRTPT
ncbi:MAG: hypothetical protein EPN72_00745 [Nevskiaceae bacterium]|nr:MAG: hypothetical protein EPN63_11495 [Nevskiaceae bacterium]TBR74588.1 MAG: hypothetical protein EPN72_00745 [Nevskiaceae bacterium]